MSKRNLKGFIAFLRDRLDDVDVDALVDEFRESYLAGLTPAQRAARNRGRRERERARLGDDEWRRRRAESQARRRARRAAERGPARP